MATAARRALVALIAVVILAVAGFAVPVVGAAPADQAVKAKGVKAIVVYDTKPGKVETARLKTKNDATIRYKYKNVPAVAVTVPPGQLKKLRAKNNVKSVELDHRLELFQSGDAELDRSWGVKRIGGGRIHLAGSLGDGVRVAIIDTGIDCTHPDLDANCEAGYSFIPGVVYPGGLASDDHGHGTHVAGVVAAERNPGSGGVVGMAPNAKLVAMKVLDASGEGDYSGLIAALDVITTRNTDGDPSNDIDVVNMSIGGHELSSTLQASIATASASGAILVGASGNVVTIPDLIYGCDVVYPAAYPQVLATTFTNQSDTLTGLSCTGPEVDFAAPGDAVVSTVPPTGAMGSASGYAPASGTSMASPHLAGTVALLLSHGIADLNGNGRLDEIEAHLCDNTDVGTGIPQNDPEYAQSFGCGVVNAGAAILDDPPGPPNDPPVVDAGGPYGGAEGDAVSISGSVADSNGDSTTKTWTYAAGADVDAGASCSFGNPNKKNTTVSCSDDGTFTLTLAGDDGRSPPVTNSATLSLVNATPVVQAGTNKSPNVDDVVSLDPATFVDAGATDTHTATIDWGDGGGPETGSVDEGTGSVDASHTYSTPGTYTATVSVDDDDGDSHSDTFDVEVYPAGEEPPPNSPPVVDAGVSYGGDEGGSISISGSVTDPDGDPTTNGWTVDDDTTCSISSPGQLDTTVSCREDGTFILTLSAFDGSNPAVTDTAALTVVNAVPIVDAGATQSVMLGSDVSLDPATFSDAGPDDTHTATVDWGDGSGPEAGVVDELDGTVSGLHSYSTPGDYTIDIAVTDDDGGVGTDAVAITVLPNIPPVVDAGGPYSGDEGAAVSISGTVTDPGDSTTKTWTWTAGGDVDAGASCSFGDAGAAGTTVSCTDDGTFSLKLKADDGFNAPVNDTATLTLGNVAPAVAITSPTPGQEFSVGDHVDILRDISDAGSNDGRSCAADWADGATSTCTAGHSYSTPGDYTIDIAVTDDDGGVGTDAVAITVLPNIPPVVDAGGPYSGDEGAAVSISGTVTDPGDSTTKTWTWTAGGDVDAGASCSFGDAGAAGTTVSCTDDGTFSLKLKADDGFNAPVNDTATLTLGNVAPAVAITSPTPGQEFSVGDHVDILRDISDAGSNDGRSCAADWADGATSTCTAGHSYSTPGDYTIDIAVTDDDGGVGTDAVAITVLPNIPPVVDAGGPYSGDEGAAVSISGTVTDPGDSTTKTWTWTAGGDVDAGASCSFGDAGAAGTTVSCTDDGTFSLKLKADDGFNAPVNDTATLTLGNVAPAVAITSPTPGQEFSVGDHVDILRDISDAGSNDGRSCAADWADGATSTCTAGHSYSTPGDYTIDIAVTDDDGGVGTDAVAITVLPNIPPVVDAGGPYSGDEGAAVSISGTVTDPGDSTTKTWTWTAGGDVDAGASCSFGDAGAAGTTVSCTDDGTFSLKLKADDGFNAPVNDTATLTLGNVAPAVAITSPTPGQEFSVGDHVDILRDISDAGSNDGRSCAADWADGATSTCTAGHSYSTPGDYTIDIAVTDDDGGVGTDAVAITVLPNIPPVVDAGGPYSGDEGAAVSISGTVTDPGDSTTKTWTWTAGGDVDAGASCSFGDAGAAGTTVSCTDDGTFSLKLKADDGFNAPVNDTATLTLGNVAPAVAITSPTPGQEFSVGDHVDILRDISDAGSNDGRSCAADWADGATSTCTAGHSYSTPGDYTIDIAVTDDDGGVGTDAVAITVLPNIPPVVDAGGPYSGDEGAAVSISGTVTDPGDSTTKTWTWTAGGDVDAGASCSFKNAAKKNTTVTCTDDGTFSLKLKADDGFNAPVNDTATLTLGNVAPAVAITSPTPGQEFSVGDHVDILRDISDAGSNDGRSCAADWADGATSTCTAGHSYSTPGDYTIDIAVTDDDGGVGTDAVAITVLPLPPTETLKFVSQEDAWINADWPNASLGSAKKLHVRLGERKSFLQFQVSGVAGRDVQSAKLRLWVQDASGAGGTAYVVDHTAWDHDTLTWNNQPALGAQLSTVGATGSGTWVVFDVSAEVDSGGTYSFGISDGSSDIVKYSSNNGVKDPELVVVVQNP